MRCPQELVEVQSVDDGILADFPVFHPVRASSAEQVQPLLSKIIRRLMKLVIRTGHIIEEHETLFMAENTAKTATAMALLHAGACTYRIACCLCGGQLKIIAAIQTPSAVTKILSHRGLPTCHLRCAVLLRLMPSNSNLMRSSLTKSSSAEAWEIKKGERLGIDYSPEYSRLPRCGGLCIKHSGLQHSF